MATNPFRERRARKVTAAADEQRAEAQLKAARRLNTITAVSAFSALVSVGVLIVTIRLTVEQMHIDQRAWVAPTDFLFLKTAAGDVYPAVNLKNTGKTFALKTSAWLDYKFDLSEIPAADDQTKVTNAGVLSPAGTWSISLANSALSASIVPEIQSGHPMYVYGTIWYSDIFSSRRHWTQFCQELGKDLVTFSPCPGGIHNGTD